MIGHDGWCSKLMGEQGVFCRASRKGQGGMDWLHPLLYPLASSVAPDCMGWGLHMQWSFPLWDLIRGLDDEPGVLCWGDGDEG